MNHTIAPLASNQVEVAAQLFANFYEVTPLVQNVFNGMNSEFKAKALRIYFDFLIRIGLAHGNVIAVSIDDKLVGVGVYFSAGCYPIKGMSRLKISINAVLKVLPYIGMKRFGMLVYTAYLLEQLHPKQAHIYTALNCVDPSFRSKGIGSSIFKYVSEISDQLQIPIYAEISNPRLCLYGNALAWK